MNNAYAALKAVADERGLPRSHAADLTKHDQQWLASEHDGRPFAWFLYANGTHLVIPRTEREHLARRMARKKAYSAVELATIIHTGFAQDDPGEGWFWWDGATLRAVAFWQVEDLLRDAEESGWGAAA